MVMEAILLVVLSNLPGNCPFPFSRVDLSWKWTDRASVGSDHMERRPPRTGEHHEPVPTTQRRPLGEAGIWIWLVA